MDCIEELVVRIIRQPDARYPHPSPLPEGEGIYTLLPLGEGWG